MRNLRFRAFAAAAAVVVALTASACGGGASGGSGGSLVFTGAGGAYQAAQTRAFFEPFSASTGIKVKQDSPISYPKLKAMVDSKNVSWDIMEGYAYFAHANCGTYVEKLDRSKLDLTGVETELVSDCAVPIMKSAFTLVYNKKSYPTAGPQSWADFFDTKKFPGKRGIMNFANQGPLEIALLGDGVQPKDIYPIDYDRAFRKLDSIRESLVFLNTGAEQEQAMASGRVDMMLSWPGRAYEVATKGVDLVAVWNQPVFYYDVVYIVKGAKNQDAAYKFLNFMLKPEQQAKLTENIAYAPINTQAQPKIDELRAKFLPSGQDNGTGFWNDQEWWAKNLDEATAKWTQWAAR
ncbi:ABC transporter substrate-binding protein [Micromonospora sp. NPDC049679]|uniref:ABC transporter substrate-binding protein n=1 Tax=Micromonospora sp. NPDC049679 TaxID=3155920 RepID=UPI0033CDD328